MPLLSPEEIFKYYLDGLITEEETISLGEQNNCLEEIISRLDYWKSDE